MDTNKFVTATTVASVVFGAWIYRDDIRALFYRLTGRTSNGAKQEHPTPLSWFFRHQRGGYTQGHLLTIPDPDSTPTSRYADAETGAQRRLFGTAG